MSAVEIDDEEDRARRRNRACVATGLLAGAGLGTLAAALVPVSAPLSGLVGAALGGVISRAIAPHISASEWDPHFSRRPFVGARSPDDDVASSS
ncbi:MAG TPA: hypothetical protein VIF57_05705 [Polyangia bacterium]